MKKRKVTEPVSLFSVYVGWIVVRALTACLNRLVELGRYHKLPVRLYEGVIEVLIFVGF